MPVYEYRCTGCGAEFERLVRAADTPACPACDGVDLERKLSVAAFGGGGGPAASSRPAPTAGNGGGCCGGGCGCH